MALHFPRTLRTSLTVEWLLMSAALLTLVLWLSIPGQIPNANAWFQDWVSRLQSRAPSPDVVLVVADDRSVATIGRWPWRRALHAQALRHISEGQPQSIGIDIHFTEEDWDYPEDDWLLAQAITDSGRVALPVLRNMHGGSHNVTLPLTALRQVLPNSAMSNWPPAAMAVSAAFMHQKGQLTPLGHTWHWPCNALVNRTLPTARLALPLPRLPMQSGNAKGLPISLLRMDRRPFALTPTLMCCAEIFLPVLFATNTSSSA